MDLFLSARNYLREYDLGGDGFTALLLNRYRPAAWDAWSPSARTAQNWPLWMSMRKWWGSRRQAAIWRCCIRISLVIYNAGAGDLCHVGGTDPPWMF